MNATVQSRRADINTLMREHDNLVRIVARKHFKGCPPTEQEDLMQDGRIGLWHAIAQHHGTPRFIKYAQRCIRNSMTDGLRQRNGRQGQKTQPQYSIERLTEMAADKNMLFQVADPTAHKQYAATDAEHDVQQAMKQLNPKQWYVVHQCDVLDTSPKEVATILGVTQSRVAQIRKTAHQLLRASLVNY